MPVVLIVIVIVFYVVRFILKQNKEQEEAARRRQRIPPSQPSSSQPSTPSAEDPPQPKTIDEILKEMHRRIETQSKPYARPAQPEKVKQKTVVKKTFAAEEIKPVVKPTEKKEPLPFLTEEYSAYRLQAEKPSPYNDDFIRKGQLTDIYNEENKKQAKPSTISVRDLIIANVILNRPEW